jgi:hypothetical protein
MVPICPGGSGSGIGPGPGAAAFAKVPTIKNTVTTSKRIVIFIKFVSSNFAFFRIA